ncbi:hypothetical protein OH77DRAFT_1310649 [Trametes cingulata]|nr:hypothetical protein OH77DRAFT_1310649 [Trametes cingulata]
MNVPPMASVFPQEIFDQIIDDSWRDAETLRQCALTCHAWLPRSRLNLFSTAVLRRSDQLHKFSRALSSSTEAAALVQELILAPPYKVKPAFINSALIALASKLPRVRKLCLVRPPFAWPDKRGSLSIPLRLVEFITRFSTLTHVVLVDLSFASFLDLVHIVTALPNLTALDCRALDWGDQAMVPHDSPMRQAGSLSLGSLAVTGSWNALHGISMLFRAVNVESLKSLTVDSNAGSSDDFETFLDVLQSYTALETFTIANLYFPWSDNLSAMHETIKCVLGSLSSSSLRRICLDFTQAMGRSRHEIVETATIMSAVAEDSLSASKFAGVEILVRVADKAESESWWVAEMEAAFWGLYTRGVLRVQVCDTWGHHPTEEVRYEDGAV